MRVTAERLALFEEIYAHHDHIDADALLDALKARGVKISRATVYRNLELLVECGLVRKQRLGHDRFLYEHVHPGQRHDHLVCRECGRVVEFVSPGIAALQAEICRAHNFDPGEFNLQIHSLCNDCSAARSPDEEEAPAEVPSATGKAPPAPEAPVRRRWLTDHFSL
jgi:Fur family ferric uptake transcriptional regulator